MAAKFKVGDRVFLIKNGWALIMKIEPVVTGQPMQTYGVQMVDSRSVYSNIPENLLSLVSS